MTAPNFGMTFTRPDDEIHSSLGADFSQTLIIETSEDASAAEIPIDTPVRGSTSDTDFMDALGTGLLADAANGIHDQLNSLNSGADVTVLRVAEGVDAAATAAAIAAAVGGIQSIPSAVNVTPRIVVAGRTAWRQDLATPNPVVVALETELPKILAVAPVDVDDTSSANAIDARETMSSDRLMPVGVGARIFDGSNVVSRPMSPRVAGLMARVDNEVGGGQPFHPFANRFIYGLSGLTRNIPFSMLDGSVEGQQMLAGNVSIVATGEVGVDGAVADGGFKFIGTDNAQTSELWQQIHQVRGTDFITTQLIDITNNYLGRRIHVSTVEAWLHSIGAVLSDHKAAGNIIGHSPKESWFTAASNSPNNIRAGKLKIELGIEPVPAFKLAEHEIRRYRPAIESMVNEIVATLASN
ncbi:phage tail protein [uncultured Roseibium sp.]|uniref:phage tail protein n=1 Tax=uncultured Roseibium sp. TaxID=1936171 RepID=UPI00261FB271|nr:phage tail protein [uncultured Roseibium sp.]